MILNSLIPLDEKRRRSFAISESFADDKPRAAERRIKRQPWLKAFADSRGRRVWLAHTQLKHGLHNSQMFDNHTSELLTDLLMLEAVFGLMSTNVVWNCEACRQELDERNESMHGSDRLVHLNDSLKADFSSFVNKTHLTKLGYIRQEWASDIWVIFEKIICFQ